MRRHVGVAVTIALADDESRNQTGHTGIDMDDRAASKIKHAIRRHEAAAPDPMRDRDIDDKQPEGQEDKHGGKLHAFGKRTGDKCGRDHRKSHLEGDKHIFGDRSRQRFHRDAGEKGLGKTANIRVERSTIGKGQRIACNHPQNGHETSNGEALHHRGEHVLLAHHAAIEQCETRYSHHQHKRG